MNAVEVDTWLALQGVPERINAQQADQYAHVYGHTFGGLTQVRSPFKHRHPKVTLPRFELATYLAGRTQR